MLDIFHFFLLILNGGRSSLEQLPGFGGPLDLQVFIGGQRRDFHLKVS